MPKDDFLDGVQVEAVFCLAMRRRLTYTVEFDREEDGRWIADVPALPGRMVYGRTRAQVLARVRKLAASDVADLMAHREVAPVDHGSAKLTLKRR